MNWRIESTSDAVGQADPVVELGEHEPQDATPDGQTIGYARTAASTMAAKLSDEPCHVEIQGHESTEEGGSFKPGHVSITISRLDPGR